MSEEQQRQRVRELGRKNTGVDWPTLKVVDIEKAMSSVTLFYWCKKDPAKYWRQGVPVGRLEIAAEGLISVDSSGVSRLMSYGEFEAEYHNEHSVNAKGFDVLTDVLIDFHPKTRPVLWRMLITQAHIYRVLIEGDHGDLADATTYSVPPIPQDQREEFEWRQTPTEATNEQVLVEPFSVSEQYFQLHLKRFAV